jgi:signal transduction histidine kinase
MRRSLILIATAGILPIVALGGAFGFTTLRAQKASVERGTIATSNFIATLAAVRLGDGMREANIIAQSPMFDGPLEEGRFRQAAERLRSTTPSWLYFSLSDASGRWLFDTPPPESGTGRGVVIDLPSLRDAVASRKPAVSDIVRLADGRYVFAIRAPIIRNGEVRYVLSTVIPAEAVSTALRFGDLPDDWRAGIMDGNGRIVADISSHPRALGQLGSIKGREAKQSGKPGFYALTLNDGQLGNSYWLPIPGTNWSVHVAAPASAYAEPTRNAWTLLTFVVLACLGLLAVFIHLLAAELRQSRERDRAEVQRQRMEALGRLTGGVAHDLNNLLTPVLGGLDLLRNRVGEDEKAQRYVALAMAGAERARSLVDRLLSFSRRQALTVMAVDVRALLTSIQELLERSAGSSVTIRVDLPPILPPIQCDPSQFELALLNIVINARDAMPRGGMVDISARPLKVSRASDLAAGDYVAIAITDTGTGMDEETMRQALEPFFTTKAAEKGTGLGLPMAHGLAVECGGALRLASREGAGTTVTIIMPQASIAPRVTRVEEVTPPAGEGRLLLVDDDLAVRSATAEILRNGGYSVAEAGSVDEALEQMSRDPSIRGVITDYFMPVRTGADLITQLHGTRPSLPVMLVSGYEPHDAEQTLPAGTQRLAKPFRADELLTRVQQMLS